MTFEIKKPKEKEKKSSYIVKNKKEDKKKIFLEELKNKRQPYKYGTQEYWKNAKTYEFDVSGRQKLQVYAYSEKSAKLKATNWEKWLVKTGRGNDKVDKNSIREIKYGEQKTSE